MNTIEISIEHHPLSGNRKYRHTPWLASRITGIPQSYIWLWVVEGLLTAQRYVGKLYVRLEDVLRLAEPSEALLDAADITGEPIPEPHATAIRQEVWKNPPEWLVTRKEEAR